MPHFDITNRITQIRTRLAAENIDAFIAIKSVNVEYLTGFDYLRDEGNPHAVLITQDQARLLTDGRYLEVAQTQAAQTAGDAPVASPLWTVDDPAGKLVFKDMHEIWDLTSFKTIALEDTIPYRLFEQLKESAAHATITPAKNWVEDVRASKDRAELARIKTAQAITDQTFDHLCSFIKPGMSEAEIALELEFTARKLGAEGLAFPPIVASGPNGSLPHAHPGERIIEPGDLLTLDFGAAYRGYCSDMTRTIFIGGKTDTAECVHPTDQQVAVYDAVLAAQEASLAAFVAGATGIEVDAAGRKVIEHAGFGEYFTHGTGHGVGLDIHELPNASTRSEEALPAGAVITCEPGIYIPGVLGVRIEDMVIVTEDGSENITSSPKHLITI
ncbi:MAG: aminopeptidase P family protein [Coriobacteriia bacterium]|nr:aminopeptidase P family protein [Coriobacteriia bacterium]MCL2536688.1 aminopeptidase P family protein [Coriobacteriia bacterium]